MDNDTISLREVLISFWDSLVFLWLKKWLVLLGAILVAALFFYNSRKKNTLYSGELTFMVSESTGNNNGGVGAILGQIGLGVGTVDGDVNLDKILKISTSRKIIKQVLLDTINVDGKEDLLANHLIYIYLFHDQWAKNKELSGFVFKQSNSAKFTIVENRAFGVLYNRMLGGRDLPSIVMVNYNEDTGILEITSESINEELSAAIAEKLYEKISAFYIKQSIASQENTFLHIKSRTDSVRQLLYQKEQRLANLKDRSTGIIRSRDNLERGLLTQEIQLLTIMYGELVKNMETSGFILDSSRPVFQIIDRPELPLSEKEPSTLKAVLLGGLIGGFVITIILLLLRFVKNILAKE